MKKSEFVKEIKNYIYEILSEDSTTVIASTSQDEENAVKANPKITGAVKQGALNALKSAKPGQQITIPVSEEVQSTDPAVKKLKEADTAAIKAIDAKIQNDPEFLKKTKEAMAKAEKGDTTDLATLMGGFGKMFESEDEDKEPTKAELAKKDSITTSANKLQKLVAKMKGLAKEYVDAKGDKKEKIKDELKKLTAEKKALEKAILPSSEED
jgi:hypothetical protein